MPTISQFFGIVVQMFWREHAPPQWAYEHRKEPMEDWDLCQRKRHPRKIRPLE